MWHVWQMARVGFYPGSFDPVTFGHLDIIARSARIVDRLVIGVGIHSGKKALLSVDERLSLVAATCKPVTEHTGLRISAVPFGGLAVDAAKEAQATVIIRGLRDATDFDYEVQMAQMNGALSPDLETIFFAASPATRMIASSLVRQIAGMGGDTSLFLPVESRQAVEAALKQAKS
jgi:pantetheine-phosphate adenylyltransferase